MMNTTVPGVRFPIKASLTEAIMIEMIEQKRKKLFIISNLVSSFYLINCFINHFVNGIRLEIPKRTI